MDERDVDARFASIVARWDGPVPDADTVADDDPGATTDADPQAAPPTQEGEAEATAADAGEPVPPPVAPRAPWVNPSPLDVVVPPSAWRSAEPMDATTEAAAEAAESALTDEEHFEPPEVVLPPQEDLHFWGAVIGLVAGPLMLLWVVFARPSHSTRWFVVSVVVSLVGFGLLILRQPTHRDPTSGDDGARV
jgi:hypothetical protein